MSVRPRPLLVAVMLACSAGTVDAQLLSPGPLARAHEEASGLQKCTSCHQLGRRGVAADRCLACHVPLADRMEAGTGYHASVPADACADCHADHLGPDFALVRLDTAAFAHEEAGYPLTGLHADVACRSCHEPARIVAPDVRARKAEHGALDRTFLGLGRGCTDCHAEEDPHDAAFGDGPCTDCHDTGGWDAPLPFDHGATHFPLLGRHRDVECASCHEGARRPGGSTLPGGAALDGPRCADCHDTPHGGAMASTCGDCHEPAGWHVLRAGALGDDFDHARTGFVLRGAHASADCASCHRAGRPPRTERLHMTWRRGTASGSYPVPEASRCVSCHVDRHAPPPGGGRWLGCTDCHAEDAWLPSSYGITRHADLSAFPLDAAHAAVPCVACHLDASGRGRFPLALGIAANDCAACHETDERHRVAYADRACTACHTTADFASVDFTHAPESEGACALCHAPDDPHDGQFADRACAACHGVETFAIGDFDHAGVPFVLDGAHAGLPCASCHVPADDGVVRYRPLGTACEDCHGGIV